MTGVQTCALPIYYYKQNQVYNISVLVVDVKTRNVITYVGNSPTDKEHQKDVDIIEAPRSTGSILKPYLYAAMLNDGYILPQTLVPDVPTQISGYSPQNFNLTYDGAVPASRALARSLNIPSVLMLQDYSVNQFYEKLQQLKLRNVNRQPSNYGLSLILGGAETKLTDLSAVYCKMAQQLECGRTKGVWLTKTHPVVSEPIGSNWSKAAIYSTFEALTEVNRPDEDNNWKLFASSRKIAWKTGTSFGFRDAWSIGVTPDYVVAVWIGKIGRASCRERV